MNGLNERTRFIFELPQDGQNWRYTADATQDGLRIDEFATIPWAWILRALAEIQDPSDTHLPVGGHFRSRVAIPMQNFAVILQREMRSDDIKSCSITVSEEGFSLRLEEGE